ncbi:hypothetical protein SUDANB146_05608 [Streptomyces sp. enrichment culture]
MRGPGRVVLRTAPCGPLCGMPRGRRARVAGRGSAAALPRAPAASARHFTRPYQTLLVQIFCSRTTSPVFGACQILLLPA